MEDDIDIEEHDVMDNPRIKSMFPDLSIVKIEQMDDVEADEMEEVEEAEEAGNEEYYQEEDEEAIDYRPQEMLYSYEYSFETTAETVSQETEDYEDYYHNNKIILGSKPPIDPETLYQSALNSTTLVCLENWGEKLKNSPCYCPDCQILFPTINALDAHKMTRHSYLVALDIQKNTARKSTVTSKYCNHCFKTFPDDTSLIKHLYELLPMNNFPNNSPDNPKITQFKCQKCKMVFNDYAASKWHKKHAHPNLSHVNNLIVKVQKSKVKLKAKATVKLEEKKENKKSKIVDSNREGKMFASASLVPKSTLFQCNICHINFISCFGAFKHSKVCKKETTFIKCGICERKIKSKDESLHKLQHEYSDKIKIYTVHKNIYEKVLYKCPKCMACFDELLFWAHYKDCNNAGSSYCPDCGINIATARYQGHRQKHKSKKYTKKDFIIVEFHDKNRQEKKEMKRVEGVKTKRARRKFDSQGVTLYFCEFCGCCQFMLSRKGHTNGTCKTNISKHFCDKCGLSVSYKSKKHHELLHQRRSFTRKNIKIFSLLTGKEIAPPSPKMYKCKKCAKHYLSQRLVKYHDCKTDKCVTCKICTKKFNLQAYKIHRHFHLESDIIPELLKKYNSIKQMWNILYKCVSCELIIVNYDSVILHAQKHFNDLQDAVMHCDICGFNVSENDFQDHETLHKNNQSIERKSFKILEFNFKDLLNDSWMNLFQSLPKQHQDQILSKSIYKYTRSIKMKIHSGPTDETNYFCINCKRYFDGNLVESHVSSNCRPNNKYVCRICHDIFKSLQTFLKHEVTHEKLIKKGIVTFNDPSDRDFNDNLKAEEKINVIKGKDKKYNIYKCAKCEVCVFLKSSMQRHSCGSRKFCVTCGEYYSSKIFCHHLTLHKRKPYINKKTLNVVFFNVEKDMNINKDKKRNDKSFDKEIDGKDKSKIDKEKDKSFSKDKDAVDKSFNGGEESEESFWVLPLKIQKQPVTGKIFRCECDLHFTSLNLIQDHLDICEQNLDISKEKCSKCNLLFPTDILVSHLIKHHSKDTIIQVEFMKKLQLYKCMECSFIFTSSDYFESHLSDCNTEITSGKKCNYCHLKFNKNCFDIHKCSARETDATYINKITKLKNQYVQTSVYKCEDCNISYLNHSSFRYHVVDVNHESKCQLTVCNVCGLQFTSYSSHKHFEIHSQTGKYKIKIIDPIHGNHSVIEGFNTIASTVKRRSIRKIETPNKKLKKDLDIPAKVHNTRRSEKRKSNLDESKSDLDLTTSDGNDDSLNPDLNNDSVLKSDDNDSKPMKKLSTKLKARILVDKYNNNLYRCQFCDLHYMKLESLQYHSTTFDHRLESELFKCDVCGLDFSKNTLPRHKYVHHQHMKLKINDFCIITDPNIQEMSKDNSDANSSQKLSLKNKITYYKCSECNVCFITKLLCYNHTKKHEILDPKMYIQCKICDFQFLIDSLKDHMESHHKVDFKVENLTIEEYKPLGDDSEPKFDTYNAVDKVQSRLVSTTTDVGLI